MSSSSGDSKHIMARLHEVGVVYKRSRGVFRSEEFWALRDVSFDVRHGETLGVIGNNGAGKSTLLRLLAGILVPSRGRVENRANFATLLSLAVGFVPNLTGRQNAMLSGMLLNVSRTEMLDAMDEIQEFSGLGEFFDEPVFSYSSGMCARLGMSVALRCDPDLLLIDEVLGVGDQEFQQRSGEAIQQKISSGRTVVLTSHSVMRIQQLCERVVWVQDGCTVEQGPAKEVIERYVETSRLAALAARAPAGAQGSAPLARVTKAS